MWSTMASELDRATAALAEVMARPIEAYSSGEVDLVVELQKTKHALHKAKSLVAAMKVKMTAKDKLIEELKTDVQEWKDHSTGTLLAWGRATDRVEEIAAEMKAASPTSDSQEYKPQSS